MHVLFARLAFFCRNFFFKQPGAAHCDNISNDVRVGPWESLDDGQLIDVDDKVVHPNYAPGFLGNDIMILHLDRPSRNQFIQLRRRSVNDGQALTVIGFGDTDPTARTEIPDQLQEVELDYVSTSDCDDVYGGVLTQDMMCAYARDADSCSGDSGGPLFVKGSTADEDELVGIVSWGYGKSLFGTPSSAVVHALY